MSSRSPGFIQRWITSIFIFLFFFIVTPHAVSAATKWTPSGVTTVLNFSDTNNPYIESSFKWESSNLAAYDSFYQYYEHEIIFDGIGWIDCKSNKLVNYSDWSASFINALGELKLSQRRFPYTECLKQSIVLTIDNVVNNDYYVDTRILDDVNDVKTNFAIGIKNPKAGVIYKVRFNLASYKSSSSTFIVRGSLGHHAANNYDMQLNTTQDFSNIISYNGQYFVIKPNLPVRQDRVPLDSIEANNSSVFDDSAELLLCAIAVTSQDIIDKEAACIFTDKDQIFNSDSINTGGNKTVTWGTISGSCSLNYCPAPSPTPTIPAGSCPANQNGNYCGESVGKTTGTLYYCNNGNYTQLQVCAYGCQVNTQGTADVCKTQTTPTASCPANQNGNYCGESVGKTTGTLYYCNNGNYTQLQVCAYGCQVNTQGTADVCKSASSTGSCPSGNGLYCGTTLGLNANTLYQCTNGVKTAVQTCNTSCQVNAPGTNDQCTNTNTTSGEFILYGNSDYNTSSYVTRFSTGKYNTDGRQYKSMKVPSGWSVYLYDQTDQRGNSRCWNTSEPFLQNQDSWYNRIKSIEVFSTDTCRKAESARVELYKNTGYGGGSMVFTNNAPSLGSAGFGNDDAESIRIEGDWVAVLFWDDNYQGTYSVIDGSRDNLDSTNVKNNQASSIQVRRKDTNRAFTLYSLGDLNGESWSSDRTIYDFGKWNWNDKAQSIRVYPGYQTILCSDANFEGSCGKTRYSTSQEFLAKDINEVANGLRNGVSSVMVCKGECPPAAKIGSLNLPVQNANIEDGIANFVWTPEINGDRYLIKVWGGALTSTIDSGWITSTNWQKTLTKSANPYYWTVTAKNPYGSSTSSTGTFFVQESVPSSVLVLGPTNVINDEIFTLDSYIVPVGTPNLTYTWSPTPLSGQGTPKATYQLKTLGITTINLTVSNTGGSRTGSLAINVGRGTKVAPSQVTMTAPAKFVTGQDFTIGSSFQPLNAYDLVYVWSPVPKAGQGTPTATYRFDDRIAHTVKLTASNGLGSVSSEVIINATNTPPVLTSATTLTGKATTLLTTQLTATDPENDAFTYSLVSGPSGLTVSPTGLLNWTPIESQIGSHIAKVQLKDFGLSSTFDIKVDIADLNPQGVDYKYFKGTYSVLPNFSSLTPAGTGTANNFNLSMPRDTNDNFAYEFTGCINITTAGEYNFFTTSDDGSKLYIANYEIVNNDGLHGIAERGGTLSMPVGKYPIKVTFFENGGDQVLDVKYSGPNIAKQNIPDAALRQSGCSTNVPTITYIPKGINYKLYKGNYSVLPDFSSLSAFSSGSTSNIHLSVPKDVNDNFAIDYRGCINITTAGDYTFFTSSDDGSKLYINNREIVNNDGLHGNQERSGTINLPVGKHSIRASFFESGGGEVMEARYQGPNISKQIIPTEVLLLGGCTTDPEVPSSVQGVNYKFFKGSYSTLPNFSSITPAKTGTIDNFKLSPRDVNDNFAFEYTACINIPHSGTYTFFTSSDDGSKLYINNSEIVNNDGLHGTQERSGSINLNAGKYPIKVTFFENGGGEVLDTQYQGPYISKQVIPNSILSRESCG